jgi:Zn-dependent protease
VSDTTRPLGASAERARDVPAGAVAPAVAPIADGPRPCPSCGVVAPARALECVACGALLEKAALEALAAEATRAEKEGRSSDAAAAWRKCLDLLPARAGQADVIRAKLDALTKLGVTPPKDKAPAIARGTGPIAVVAMMLWKMKWLAAFVLGNGKVLLLGATKVTTLVSMLATVGVYWSLWGLPFAVGIVLCIYVHEMGHVIVLRRFGVAADAPVFIPGVGALIRARQKITDPVEDAVVGLAGPVAGLAATVLVQAAAWLLDSPALAAIAHVNAIINLFNLLPLFSLDGGRAFHALSRVDRFIVVGALAGALMLSGEGMLLIVLVGAVMRALGAKDTQGKGHTPTLIAYVALVAALTWFAWIGTGAAPPAG